MKPSHHVIISGVAGLVVSSFYNSWLAFAACFLSGVLIDVDHVLDFYLEKKEIPWTYKRLLHFCERDKRGRLYLVFHGYEYVLLLAGVLYFFPNAFFMGLTVGLLLHMLCDHLTNPFRPWGYFIIYRMTKKFERKYVFTQKYVREILQIS